MVSAQAAAVAFLFAAIRPLCDPVWLPSAGEFDAPVSQAVPQSKHADVGE